MSNLTCKDGIVIPSLAVTPRNAVLYLAGLLYCFVGIAIAADTFMCAIEKITSATRKVKRKSKKDGLVADPTDEEQFVEVKIWNATVANLTLMALGSSAPEILLSIIEIVGNNFKAGDLGPGTIVGSAAFNLFCISAICVLSVKSPAAKKIEMFKVFVVTAFFGTFAYIWLLVILSLISPDVVEVWEAALTLIFFVVLVAVAYAADVQIWKSKKADLSHELAVVDIEAVKRPSTLDDNIKRYASQVSLETDGAKLVGPMPTPDLYQVRELSRSISRVYPTLSPEDQAKILAYRMNRVTQHDRAYYRIRAIREMTSSWRKSNEEQEIEEKLREIGVTEEDGKKVKPTIEFSARVYAVYPGDRRVVLTIVRGGPCSSSVTVNYSTVNGLAKRDLHYLSKCETIAFAAEERSKNIFIDLVEGADWRPNHVFYVHLKIQEQSDDDKVKLGPCGVARVRFPDESASLMGVPSVEFVKNNYVAKENCGLLRTFVSRRGKNHSGPLTVTYETNDVTAQQNLDYLPEKNGKLTFVGQEYEKYIDVEIVDDKMDEKDETFTIELLETDSKDVSIGSKKRTTVTIISDDNMLKNIVNVHKLMDHYLRKLTPGQATWKEQIVNATSVNAGDVPNATLSDCVKHALAFPWKFAMAFIPPASILGGWPCFIVALAVIGFITAIVGDLASIFGCMVGIPDSITAITLVALGTSLPDTFASKIAAENDDTADNAVGNVTGSNSVNVFLGLGLPWLLAAIYWSSKGETFVVPSGDLSFSVAVFMVCSVLFLAVLMARRNLAIFGKAELGGPFGPKIASGLFFIALWIVYVVLSIRKSYSK